MFEQKITYLTDIALLIEKKIKEKAARLALQEMPHMPTLGSGYEAISKTMLDMIIKKEFGATVYLSEGFIRIDGATATSQIDIVLSSQPGEQFGDTTSYYHDIENVLCIIEVKKTLNKAAFTDSMQHLTEIKDLYIEAIDKKTIPLNSAAVSHAKSAIEILKRAPLEIDLHARKLDLSALTLPEKVLFWSFYLESALPPYIVHGFDGYRTELGLQNAFADYVDNQSIKKKWITYIPSLVTSGELSVVKATGNPFFYKDEEEASVFFMSANSLPMELMLMIITNRLIATKVITDPWGAIYTKNSFSPFLKASVDLEETQTFSARFVHVLFERDMLTDDAYRLKNPPPPMIGAAATQFILTQFFKLRVRQRSLCYRIPPTNDPKDRQALEEIENIGIPVDLEGFIGEVTFAFKRHPSNGTAMISQSIATIQHFAHYYKDPELDVVITYKNGVRGLEFSDDLRLKLDMQINNLMDMQLIIPEETARKLSLLD